MTAAELARRLEKEGVVAVSFFAGEPAHSCCCCYHCCRCCCCRCRLTAAAASLLEAASASMARMGELLAHLPPRPSRLPLPGYEAACRAPLNQLNAAVHGLHGLATGVQVHAGQRAALYASACLGISGPVPVGGA